MKKEIYQMDGYLLPAVTEICNLARELDFHKYTMISLSQLKYLIEHFQETSTPIQLFTQFVMRVLKGLTANKDLYEQNILDYDGLYKTVISTDIISKTQMENIFKDYIELIKKEKDEYKNFIKIGFNIPDENGISNGCVIIIANNLIRLDANFTPYYKLLNNISNVNYPGPYQLVAGNPREYNVILAQRIFNVVKKVLKDSTNYKKLEYDLPRDIFVTVLAPFCFDDEFKHKDELLEIINGAYTKKKALKIIDKLEEYYNDKKTAITHTILGIEQDEKTKDYTIIETFTLYKDISRRNSKYNSMSIDYCLSNKADIDSNFTLFIRRLSVLTTLPKLLHTYEKNESIGKFIMDFDTICSNYMNAYNRFLNAHNKSIHEKALKESDDKNILWN